MENNLKEYLENFSGLHKFGGVAPEGFVIIHEKTLEDLQDFDIWKSWKNNEVSLFDLNKKNFLKFDL